MLGQSHPLCRTHSPNVKPHICSGVTRTMETAFSCKKGLLSLNNLKAKKAMHSLNSIGWGSKWSRLWKSKPLRPRAAVTPTHPMFSCCTKHCCYHNQASAGEEPGTRLVESKVCFMWLWNVCPSDCFWYIPSTLLGRIKGSGGSYGLHHCL